MCADELSILINLRIELTQKLNSSKDYTELETSVGRLKRSDAIQRLEYINKRVSELQRSANARRGPATNQARLHRA